MKKLTFENSSLVVLLEFLDKVELKPKASRGSRQLLKRLLEKYNEFQEDLKAIRKDYFQMDAEEDEFIQENGVLLYKLGITEANKEEADQKVEELMKEKVEISFAEYSSKYETLFKGLDELDMTLSGEDAFAYDALMEAYENNKGGK